MQFITAKNIQPKKTMAVLLYGATGIGKTTLALSSPNPALVDFDGGITRVDAKFWCNATAQVTKWEGWSVMVRDLSSLPADTIIIDHVGKMLDLITNYVLEMPKYASKNLKKPSLQAFGDIKIEFVSFLRGIKAIGKNIVFVAQEVESIQNTPKGDIRYHQPACGSDKNRTEILQDLDLVGYMFMDGDKTVLTFDKEEDHYGKNTCKLDKYIPYEVCNTSEDNYIMKSIYDIYVQNQKDNIEQLAAYEKQLSEILPVVDKVVDAESANEFVKCMKGEKFLMDAKTKVTAALNEKVAALGLKWNSSKKCYE